MLLRDTKSKALLINLIPFWLQNTSRAFKHTLWKKTHLHVKEFIKHGQLPLKIPMHVQTQILACLVVLKLTLWKIKLAVVGMTNYQMGTVCSELAWQGQRHFLVIEWDKYSHRCCLNRLRCITPLFYIVFFNLQNDLTWNNRQTTFGTVSLRFNGTEHTKYEWIIPALKWLGTSTSDRQHDKAKLGRVFKG